MTRFAGKVALVTGAGSGIGAAVACGLAAEGAAVAAFDIDEAAAPGTVRTPMLRAIAAETATAETEPAVDRIGRAQPRGRVLEAEEVARLALFLLSDEESGITGACHRVDGGLLSRLPA